MNKKRGRQVRSGQNYDRTDRVSGLIREIVASELERIDDPRLFLISLTGVDVDRELAHATVWFHASEDDDLEEVTEAFESHRQRMQQALSRQSRMRRTPAIHFQADRSIQEAGRIESILEELNMDGSGRQTEAD
ncbi:MAG TPA: 30S ribosome-binding factor RbfA [Acidimicrobiaceae bacterium]|nr:30S ribosome-binding factor RbfA [Acidimicrobiaceae bacterium]HAX04605.1 30S ribosome-binding factor RbfA [Acidimicrobiaceae bacterium]|tara:strand:+ start:556 stop:957 length:402 start_codon:yes stop_codon:yes gene_type:complete